MATKPTMTPRRQERTARWLTATLIVIGFALLLWIPFILIQRDLNTREKIAWITGDIALVLLLMGSIGRLWR